ncbi:RNA pseudouridine synthase [Flavobacteriaceae bacterium]|jgi:23S rRNA pseudouridine1911/1915/1917 synthase|nr:RNA pseudouridine synthase [Flavobacteriaceae bacterium]
MHSTKDNLEVLFEDNHLLIVNKKSGDIVQGDKTGDKPLSDVVKEYIKEKYNKPGEVFLGVVHRLDRPTSGIIIFARTSKALERLNKMLRERTISKTYWAVVKNTPLKEKDSLIHFLKKNPKNNKSTVFTKETDASKKAILHYLVIKKLDNYSLLKIDLETGRHHQIRAQLAYIGSPIKGDLKYGASRSNKDGSIHLHARKILFTHPVSKENISVLAPIPNETIWNACL